MSLPGARGGIERLARWPFLTEPGTFLIHCSCGKWSFTGTSAEIRAASQGHADSPWRNHVVSVYGKYQTKEGDQMTDQTTASRGAPAPAKYRKRPVVVEARQWNPGDLERAGEVVGWLLASGVDFHHPSGMGDTTTLAIRGQRLAEPGDWIIRDQGEFFPCKPDIFEATYELAELAPQTTTGRLELAAIAAYGPYAGCLGEAAMEQWARLVPDRRGDWRGVADAVRMVSEMGAADPAAEHASRLQAATDELRAKVADELAAEVKRLRQGLWDIAGIAGEDQDGNTSPDVLKSPDIVEYAAGAVRELRDSYDDALSEGHAGVTMSPRNVIVSRAALKTVLHLFTGSPPFSKWTPEEHEALRLVRAASEGNGS